MKPGKSWSSWQPLAPLRDLRRWGHSYLGTCVALALLFCFLGGGCAHTGQHRADVDKNVRNDREITTRDPDVVDHYQVGCPDVLAIEVAARPSLKTRQMVGADGRIELRTHGKLGVEGRTPAEIADLVAAAIGVAPTAVKVRVAEYRSQQLFLFGQVIGWQRSVPYRGQETVLDLLQRVGGISHGAEPRDVYVVRAHIAEGGRPEVYHVDWHAIVVGHDQKTNLRLLPNDQIYIGETRQDRIERIIPPWVRPLYQAIWNAQPK